MNVLTTSGEKIITKCSYTFDNSVIYFTIISATLNGIEEPKAKGEKGIMPYSFNNGVLAIINKDNIKITFHRVDELGFFYT